MNDSKHNTSFNSENCQQLELLRSNETHNPKHHLTNEIPIHEKRISGFLTVILPDAVDVILTNNRSTMVSFKKQKGRYIVRLHKIFRHADETILRILATYLTCDSSAASAAIDSFIGEHQEEIRAGNRERNVHLKPTGQHHNLNETLSRVNAKYFNNKAKVDITWGRKSIRTQNNQNPLQKKTHVQKHLKSRALASYDFDLKVIRVHRVLDTTEIPSYVLDWIVFHELLHHVLPVEKDIRGNSKYHTKHFRQLEQAFERYEDAKRWERKNQIKLLS